jgi:N,N'-diacetyllegionaminate synthase
MASKEKTYLQVKMKSVKLDSFLIGGGHPIHIIAEIGGNFLNFEEAKRLIDLAIGSGADSVKLQTYKANTIASKKATYDMPNTGIANQYDLFKQYEIDFTLHQDIWNYCSANNILVFSTPSHLDDIELLEKLDCAIYKIGSDDACNIPFLKQVAAIGKPIILSTGMCTMEEVRESVSAILSENNDDLILLHCVTNYPAKVTQANLKCITSMKREFGLPVGYSDHTLGNICSFAAASIGADLIEKHFTNDHNADGPDHMLSAEPAELKELVEGVRDIESALGDGIKRPSQDESVTRLNNRKSIVSNVEIKQGTLITRNMLSIKRPGMGIEPKYFEQVIGRVANTDIPAEDTVYWDYI